MTSHSSKVSSSGGGKHAAAAAVAAAMRVGDGGQVAPLSAQLVQPPTRGATRTAKTKAMKTATATTATATTAATSATTSTRAAVATTTGRTQSSSSSSSSPSPSTRFWLFAFRDHLAGLQAYTHALCTADVSGNDDYKLLVADGSQRLKVYSGTTLQQELRLPGVPTAVVSFYMASDAASSATAAPRHSGDGAVMAARPVVAVAIGPYIFMYRDLKPLYRYTLPDVPLRAAEVQLWQLMVEGAMSVDDAVREVEALRQAHDAALHATDNNDPCIDNDDADACARMTELLLLDRADERAAFVQRMRNVPLREPDVVTCMATLPLYYSDAAVAADELASNGNGTSAAAAATAAMSMAGVAGTLVLGTERRYVYVLHENMVDMVASLRLASAPIDLLVAGCLRVDYRLVVACRDDRIYIVKNGVLGASVLQPTSAVVAMARYEQYVAVATMRQQLLYYTLKGRQHACVSMPLPITNMAALGDTVTGATRGLVVAIGSGELRVYVGTALMHVSQACGVVTAMRYTRYSREDAALVLVLQNGSLMVQLVHRHAMLLLQQRQQQHDSAHHRVLTSSSDGAGNDVAVVDGKEDADDNNNEGAMPLMPVPPLSSAFDECTARERGHGIDMYTTFVRAYCYLQLQTARAYLRVLRSSSSSSSSASMGCSSIITSNSVVYNGGGGGNGSSSSTALQLLSALTPTVTPAATTIAATTAQHATLPCGAGDTTRNGVDATASQSSSTTAAAAAATTDAAAATMPRATTTSTAPPLPLARLATALYGGGPTFRLCITMHNTSAHAVLNDLLLLVTVDGAEGDDKGGGSEDGVLYVDKPMQRVAYVAAASRRQCTTLLRVTADMTCDDAVTVRLLHEPTRRLLAMARVALPDVDKAEWL